MDDSLGNRLVIGKYYRLRPNGIAQYTGIDDNNLENHMFEYINRYGERIVLIRTPHALQELPPIQVDDYENDTDNEFGDNPYVNDTDEDENVNNVLNNNHMFDDFDYGDADTDPEIIHYMDDESNFSSDDEIWGGRKNKLKKKSRRTTNKRKTSNKRKSRKTSNKKKSRKTSNKRKSRKTNRRMRS
jgi:hypothetical protein